MSDREDKNPARPSQDAWNLLVRAVFQYTCIMGTVGQQVLQDRREAFILRQKWERN